ncbi:hypothetical protein [Lysobacter claricitrinus]|uniref:hypothetical protein n=1 Tax=Lysobacter claricitrinus TaxID=3367728 RepID=UPI0038B2F391
MAQEIALDMIKTGLLPVEHFGRIIRSIRKRMRAWCRRQERVVVLAARRAHASERQAAGLRKRAKEREESTIKAKILKASPKLSAAALAKRLRCTAQYVRQVRRTKRIT